MTIRLVALCAGTLTGLTLLAIPVAACDTAPCPAAAQSQPEPLRLNKFMRRPVASAATRMVKTRDGSYAQVSLARRAKPRLAISQPKPDEVSADAAQAFASHAAAQVRVVAAEEVNEIDLAADAAAVVTTTAVEVVAEPAVQVVSADEINDIDRKADAPRAVSLDELNRLAAPALAANEPEKSSWIQRMLIVLGGAFAAASAAARLLIG